MFALLPLILGVQVLLTGGASASVRSTLKAGHSLAAGQALWSTDGRYEAVMQGDGNFVEYGPSGVVWDSATGVAGSHIVMQGDGNLVIYTPSGSAVWSSSTAPSSNDRLVMQTDGNLVIYSGGTALWAKGKLLTGPPGPYNAGIITKANAVRSGTYGGQCLVWVANIVKAARPSRLATIPQLTRRNGRRLRIRSAGHRSGPATSCSS